jgi:hypothetical protein
MFNYILFSISFFFLISNFHRAMNTDILVLGFYTVRGLS